MIPRSEKDVLLRNLEYQKSNEKRIISEVLEIRRNLISEENSVCLKPTEVENVFEEKLNLIKTSLENEFKIQIANLDNQLSKLRAELHAREINESIRKGMLHFLPVRGPPISAPKRL